MNPSTRVCVDHNTLDCTTCRGNELLGQPFGGWQGDPSPAHSAQAAQPPASPATPAQGTANQHTEGRSEPQQGGEPSSNGSELAPDEPVIEIATFKDVWAKEPTSGGLTWDQLKAKLLREHLRGTRNGDDGKKAMPMWSPATYKPGTTRAKENVLAVTAAAVDFDHAGDFAANVRPLLSGLTWLAHSTWRHTKDEPRYRVVVPLTEPVPADQWEDVFYRIRRHVFNDLSDDSCKDASRMHSFPAHPPDATDYWMDAGEQGQPLDWRTLPPLPDRPESGGAAEQPLFVVAGGNDGGQVYERVVGPSGLPKTLNVAIKEMQYAKEGDRNNTLNICAFAMGKQIYKGRVARAEVEHRLAEMAQTRGLQPHEIDATLNSGIEAGIHKAHEEDLAQEDLIPKLGRAAREQFDAIAVDKGRDVFVYEGGVYRRAERQIEQFVTEHLGTINKTLPQEDQINWSSRIVDEVRKYLSITAPELWLEPPLHIVNVQNGLLMLEAPTDQNPGGSVKLVGHTPDHLSRVQVPVRYDPEAKCPNVDAFIDETLFPDAVRTFWEVVGLLLVPDNRWKKAFLFFGPADAGKSRILELIQHLLGEDNYSNLNLQDVCDRFKRYELLGKLANLYADIDPRRPDEADRLMALVGNDSMVFEKKYVQSFSARAYTRLLFSGNKLPRVPARVDKDGWFTRWLIFECPNVVPEDSRDQHLMAKLGTPQELSGMLNKGLGGWLSLHRQHGFTQAGSITHALELYRQTHGDLVKQFVDAAFDMQPGTNVVLRGKALQQYATFLEEREPGAEPPSQAEFTRRIEELLGTHIQRSFNADGWPTWRGIAWRAAPGDGDADSAPLVRVTRGAGNTLHFG